MTRIFLVFLSFISITIASNVSIIDHKPKSTIDNRLQLKSNGKIPWPTNYDFMKTTQMKISLSNLSEIDMRNGSEKIETKNVSTLNDQKSHDNRDHDHDRNEDDGDKSGLTIDQWNHDEEKEMNTTKEMNKVDPHRHGLVFQRASSNRHKPPRETLITPQPFPHHHRDLENSDTELTNDNPINDLTDYLIHRRPQVLQKIPNTVYFEDPQPSERETLLNEPSSDQQSFTDQSAGNESTVENLTYGFPRYNIDQQQSLLAESTKADTEKKPANTDGDLGKVDSAHFHQRLPGEFDEFHHHLFPPPVAYSCCRVVYAGRHQGAGGLKGAGEVEKNGETCYPIHDHIFKKSFLHGSNFNHGSPLTKSFAPFMRLFRRPTLFG